MGYSLLGAHVNSTVGGLPESILAWKPPLVVVLDHSSAWHDVKAGSPKTAFVGRFIQDQSEEPNFDDPNVDPRQFRAVLTAPGVFAAGMALFFSLSRSEPENAQTILTYIAIGSAVWGIAASFLLALGGSSD